MRTSASNQRLANDLLPTRPSVHHSCVRQRLILAHQNAAAPATVPCSWHRSPLGPHRFHAGARLVVAWPLLRMRWVAWRSQSGDNLWHALFRPFQRRLPPLARHQRPPEIGRPNRVPYRHIASLAPEKSLQAHRVLCQRRTTRRRAKTTALRCGTSGLEWCQAIWSL